jgi:hypothetical protein
MEEKNSKDSPSISREIPKLINLDFESLRKLGLGWVQELGHEHWTDYNLHDPGVTILEYLCYGLLDLGYHTEFDIRDILFAISDQYNHSPDTLDKLTDQAFHLPEDIFPSGPTTINDYKKLILDRVKRVRNVWIEPIQKNEFGIETRGMYEVYIQLGESVLEYQKSKESQALEEEDSTIKAVSSILEENRNLCERFLHISVPRQIEISIDTGLKVSLTADPAMVKAEVFFQIYQFLRNNIYRYSRTELEEEGLDTGDLFEGPLMANGFIKERELEKLDSSLIISELRDQISRIEDVLNVEYFRILIDGVSRFDESIVFEKDEFPVIDMQSSKIQISNAPDSGSLVEEMTHHYLSLMITRQEKGYYPSLESTSIEHDVRMSKKAIEQYHSIQRIFPAFYNIGDHGPGPYATRQELAAAKQLKSYLLLFEQVIADYLAQLAHAPELFSIQKDCDKKTYFAQLLTREHIPRLEELFRLNESGNKWDDEASIDEFHTAIQQLTAQKDDYFKRKNQFLDHLLARFGEAFPIELIEKIEKDLEIEEMEEGEQHGQVDQPKSTDKGLPGEPSHIPAHAKVLEHKARLLRQYPQVSRDKALAENYLNSIEPKSSPGKRSGAFEKLRRLLMLEDREKLLSQSSAGEGFYWIENILLYPQQTPKLFIRLLNTQGNSLLESKEARAFNENQEDPASRILFYGTQSPPGQKEKTGFLQLNSQEKEGKTYFLVQLNMPEDVNGPALTLKTPEDKWFTTEEEAEEQRQSILEYLKKIKTSELERVRNHFEFAPGDNVWKFDTLFGDTEDERIENIINDPGRNFYNYRLSLVLPAWKGRFARPEFQRYLMEVAPQCIPLHLAVDFFWVDSIDKMASFETAYTEWVKAYQEHTQEEEKLIELDEKAGALIKALFTSGSFKSF